MALTPAEESDLSVHAARFGASLDPAALRQLSRFLDELSLWNERINLVGDRGRGVLIVRHLLDSLAPASILRSLAAGSSVADLGSGAGLPGVPLAIAFRDLRFCLIEPRRKRASFLRAVARALPELELDVRQERIEDLVRSGVAFDAIVSRAAPTTAELRKNSLLALRPGGLLIAFKGPAARSEEESSREVESRTLAGDPQISESEIVPYRLPTESHDRRLFVWRRCFT
jgi:16S rRNA (guanine527-N7)-methyltransferase